MRCKWYHAMRWIWFDAILVFTTKDPSDYSRLSLNGIFKQRHAGIRIAIGRRYDIRNQYHAERVYCTNRCICSDAMRCIWPDAMRCIWPDAMRCICSRTTKDPSDYKPMHMLRCDAVHMIRCDAVHMVRCGAVHMVRCRSCLYNKIRRTINPCICSDAVHMFRCDAYGPMPLLFVLLCLPNEDFTLM